MPISTNGLPTKSAGIKQVTPSVKAFKKKSYQIEARDCGRNLPAKS